jgi:hypothetical protein
MDNGEKDTDKDTDLPGNGKAVTGLVVIGASAGGVEALQTLIGTLPADFPVPIVIAQHLDPHRKSRLREILAARSALPVREISAYEPLLAATVYVVPADHDVEISDHHVGLRKDGVSRSQPSVDLLMGTAARVFGDSLTGVILTGAGMDGVAGARAIKAYGGTVIVQNPESAKFSGMPSSIPPSMVDILADLEAIGPLLVDLFSGTHALAAEHDGDDLRSFLDVVRERSGVDFGAYKRPTIERRLQRRMVAVGAATLAEYRRYVDRHPEEMQRLVTSLLIKVTQFFRDPELFAYLRDRVLPDLIEEARKRGSCGSGRRAAPPARRRTRWRCWWPTCLATRSRTSRSGSSRPTWPLTPSSSPARGCTRNPRSPTFRPTWSTAISRGGTGPTRSASISGAWSCSESTISAGAHRFPGSTSCCAGTS